MFKFLFPQTAFYILSQTACNRTKPVCDYRAHCGNVKDFFHYLYNFFCSTWLMFVFLRPGWSHRKLFHFPSLHKAQRLCRQEGWQSGGTGGRARCPIDTPGTHRRAAWASSPLPRKMHWQNVHSRDGNVITAQVSKLLMGLRNVCWCTGNDVWQFDLARGLFCMPNTAPCSVLSFWFTLQCFNVKASGDMGSYCRDVCSTGWKKIKKRTFLLSFFNFEIEMF